MKIFNLLIVILLSQSISGQVLSDFIPSNMKTVTEINEVPSPQDFISNNAARTWGADYYNGDQMIVKVKSGLFNNTSLDFDENEYKFGQGYELVDIDILELKGITFPMMEFDAEDHNKYMTQFSVIMHSDKSFEIQNYFNLEKYSSDRIQLRYVISGKSWGSIMEVLSYMFYQTSKSRIDVNPSVIPVERLYVDDYDFSSSTGEVNVFAVGQSNEIMIFESKLMEENEPMITRRYLVKAEGLHNLLIKDMPQKEGAQMITISDINNTVLVQSQIGEDPPIIITDPIDPPTKTGDDGDNEDDGVEDNGEIVDEEINVFPNVVANELTVRTTRNPLQNNRRDQVYLLDRSGDLVQSFTNTDPELKLDMSYMKRGMYYLVYDNGKNVVTKIVTKI